MAPKPPPKPPPPKNVFERFSDYLDSDRGKRRTTILVLLFFVLAVVMYYKTELNKGQELIVAVASIRKFALEYDPSLYDKNDMEILAAVHLHTLHLLNWTLKNEKLQNELDILIEMLPGWQAFESNLYYFSDIRKSWHAAREDCLARHTADLVSCRYGEEQGFLDMMAAQNKREYWIGLRKNSSATNGLLWLAGFHAGTTYWARDQPNSGDEESCIATFSDCSLKACWHDAPCNEARYFCCKMIPEDMWFY
ncbi:C-type lectin domain family 4 member K-like isoform X2 [Pantherophis guttatus]|uniref:C-type lectin domain family 4 member K-like isoform X2 n=1 Tax=Pantherophis guttatus TaxID=94885 RepID=A0ABM3YQC5_PANGU|nr:C-type lectin domain family 4 member K-like isoform X2 [Pantherophis guttatus]